MVDADTENVPAVQQFSRSDLASSQAYVFTVTGTYSSPNALELELTVTSGRDSATVTATVDPADYPGTFFGGTGRFRRNFTVDFETFSATRP